MMLSFFFAIRLPYIFMSLQSENEQLKNLRTGCISFLKITNVQNRVTFIDHPGSLKSNVLNNES